MEKSAFIVGATSSIAIAVCHELAKNGYRLALSSRDAMELKILASDLEIRYGAKVQTFQADLSFVNFSAKDLVDNVFSTTSINEAYIFSGHMGTQEISLNDLANIRNTIKINFAATAEIIALVADKMLQSGDYASIAIISSVAGDRGRASNFIYGSAKAALTAFASGLRNRLSGTKVHVMTVKPGFIDTPMTYGMASPLIFPREKAAKKIIEALKKKKNVVYIPFFWRYIMLIITSIPEKIFKKLKL